MTFFPFGIPQTPRPVVSPAQRSAVAAAPPPLPPAPQNVQTAVVPEKVTEPVVKAEETKPAVVPEVPVQDTPPAEATVPAALPETSSDEADKAAEAKKKREHEEKEAKREAEFDARQKAKKEADANAIKEWEAMSDDEITDRSSKKAGEETERLTKRNMKILVTEHIQRKCESDNVFARVVCHPRKNMINCFKFINRKAREYLEQEMKDNDEKPVGNGFGGDVPDDLCYQWAEEYFYDANAKEDEVQEEKFVPNPYRAPYKPRNKGAKDKKKTPAKEKSKSEKKPEPLKENPAQVTFGEVAAA